MHWNQINSCCYKKLLTKLQLHATQVKEMSESKINLIVENVGVDSTHYCNFRSPEIFENWSFVFLQQNLVRQLYFTRQAIGYEKLAMYGPGIRNLCLLKFAIDVRLESSESYTHCISSLLDIFYELIYWVYITAITSNS